ncbi:hypothetical protein [Merismopedia glauca]|uniref:hypothetical protein n=1 Tax=Merismopedia glauca TaxID=292586 RepID=UPI0015E7A61D|nr:hypothetical protein [Merismopedia glauca]
MKKDEVINQIRQIRHKISEEQQHDPKKLVNYYMELQKQYPNLNQLQEEQVEVVRA